MSANFTGVTFPNQKVTPAYDAIIRRALLDDGILTGCALSYSGSTLTMAAGQLMLCGRQIIHPSSQNWAVAEATTGYARLVLTIDLTRTSTKDTFDQVVDEIQYATAVDGFTALVQSDINAAGSKYQVAACVVSLGPGGITGIVSQLDATEGGGAGGILTVTAPAGVVVTASNGEKAKAKISGASGVVTFKGLKSGTWTVSISDGEQTASKAVEITTDYSMAISLNAIPEFTYTGDFEIVSDDDQPITVSQDNWKIRFLTSGTLIFTSLNGAEEGIDVFLVGGGGGSQGVNVGTGGGGGGYTTTEMAVSITVGTSYDIIIGAGGSGSADGGTSSAFGVSASGGRKNNGANGGNGGSGGGGYQHAESTGSCTGGSDGGNGGNGYGSTGGTGQGTTTREFGDGSGKLYAGGGGGSSSKGTNYPEGGAGGGGKGGRYAGGGNGTNGEANTGGGAGGAASNGYTSGGSGIVIIRNAREAA